MLYLFTLMVEVIYLGGGDYLPGWRRSGGGYLPGWWRFGKGCLPGWRRLFSWMAKVIFLDGGD